MPVAPGAVIEALPSAPPTISLLTSAIRVPNTETGAWEAELQWEPEVGALNLTDHFPYWWDCPEGAGTAASVNAPSNKKPIPDGPPIRRYRPYIAHSGDECATL